MALRTAESYYEKYSSLTGLDQDDFTQVLNEARKEAIEEAAEVAEIELLSDCVGEFQIDKQSILNLLTQIK